MSQAALTPVVLGPNDLVDALTLSDGAGWNQRAEDWALFVEHGRVSGRRNADGVLVASAAALPYGLGQGWISMVLVSPTYRHRGLATDLLNEAIATLRQAGCVPVLDATPAGAMVYRRLGFEPGFEFQRWQGELSAASLPQHSHLRRATARDLDTINLLDAAASRVERRVLLQSFLARPGTRAWIACDGSGFVIVREGRRAWQLGPLVAGDEASALALLQQALASTEGPLFLDLPLRWAALAQVLVQHGFQPQRPFVRMALGEAPALAGSERLFVVAGPEFG